jgi:hypothetical protein
VLNFSSSCSFSAEEVLQHAVELFDSAVRGQKTLQSSQLLSCFLQIETKLTQDLGVAEFSRLGLGSFLKFVILNKDSFIGLDAVGALLDTTSEPHGPIKASDIRSFFASLKDHFLKTRDEIPAFHDEVVVGALSNHFGVSTGTVVAKKEHVWSQVEPYRSSWPLAAIMMIHSSAFEITTEKTPVLDVIHYLEQAPYLTDLEDWIDWENVVHNQGSFADFVTNTPYSIFQSSRINLLQVSAKSFVRILPFDTLFNDISVAFEDANPLMPTLFLISALAQPALSSREAQEAAISHFKQQATVCLKAAPNVNAARVHQLIFSSPSTTLVRFAFEVFGLPFLKQNETNAKELVKQVRSPRELLAYRLFGKRLGVREWLEVDADFGKGRDSMVYPIETRKTAIQVAHEQVPSSHPEASQHREQRENFQIYQAPSSNAQHDAEGSPIFEKIHQYYGVQIDAAGVHLVISFHRTDLLCRPSGSSCSI